MSLTCSALILTGEIMIQETNGLGGYWGKWRGIVSRLRLSQGIPELKAFVPKIGGKNWELPAWASACVPYAGRNPQSGKRYGHFSTPRVGDGVWIEFEGGDLRYPIWTGFWFFKDSYPPEGAQADIKVKTPTKDLTLATPEGTPIPNRHGIKGNSSGYVAIDDDKDFAILSAKTKVLLTEWAAQGVPPGDLWDTWLESFRSYINEHRHIDPLSGTTGKPVAPFLDQLAKPSDIVRVGDSGSWGVKPPPDES